jgi:hypothetical protein
MADVDGWIRIQVVSSRQIGHAILGVGDECVQAQITAEEVVLSR